MNFNEVQTMEDMLRQLPPEMSKLIRTILMASDSAAAGATPGEVVSGAIESTVKQNIALGNGIFSPFFIICIITCLIVFIGVRVYAEYKVSKRPELTKEKYSPIGTYILKYCHDYEKISAMTMRDEIDNIYSKCLFRYEQKELLQQRKDEILSDRKKEKIKNYLCIVIFMIVFLFFFLVGIGGVYIGYEFKGIVLMSAITFIAHEVVPFIFPYRTDSYECLQVKEFRNIVENYELEKIKNLL